MSENSTAVKYEFKTEVKKLLDILVHSLYTSREIFLRELISNASDALDKLRFVLNRNTDIVDKELPLEITIQIDDKKKILIVTDTGIGMTKEEVINNIGTIAKSGTEEFLKILSEAKEETNNLIGKFGIGFYSVFMVAKEVVIKTKSYKSNEIAVQWRSDGTGEYEITELNEKMPRGTRIEIYLKDDAAEFAEKWRIESIIKKHSNFISYPIYIDKERINTISAIWREPKSSIKKEQYDEFYKFLTYDSEEPADVIHKSIDAPIQFNALLFIPKKSSEFYWLDRENYGLDLYVKRVLIQHKNKDLLPEYLSFIKGVVDSEDLPLNISRETLQENIIFNKIASSVTNTVLTYLIEKAKVDKEGYEKFWKEHGKIFKLGYIDFANHDKYIELLRFNSSKCKNEYELVSLQDYVDRKLENQKEIYYASGINRETIESSPHMELFKKKSIEVLYFYDPVDELIIASIRKYRDNEFKSIETIDPKKIEEFKTVEEEKFEKGELNKDDRMHFSSLLSKMKKILGDKVLDVVESSRLVDSAACLVSKDKELTSTMQKILRMTNRNIVPQKKILEINPNNKMIRNLIKIFKNDSNDEFIKVATEQLFDLAILGESELEDIHTFIKRSNKILEDISNLYVNMKKL